MAQHRLGTRPALAASTTEATATEMAAGRGLWTGTGKSRGTGDGDGSDNAGKPGDSCATRRAPRRAPTMAAATTIAALDLAATAVTMPTAWTTLGEAETARAMRRSR